MPAHHRAAPGTPPGAPPSVRSPIVDAHLHLWDPGALRYPWLDGHPLLDRSYLLADYAEATRGLDVQAMVFVQCEVEPASAFAEAEWVATLAAEHEPRIRALVAWAALEKGARVAEDLARLARHGILRGIRRIIQFEDDPGFCLRPAFVEGVRTLRDFGLSFDICIDHRQMAAALRFAEQLPDVPMVLDHIGKPDIRGERFEPWASQLREFAALPHVSCKVSGVATEAVHDAWTPKQLEPYIAETINAFGFDRVMFGGDWPVSLQAVSYRAWIELIDRLLSHANAYERQCFWHDNATRFYRLGETA